MAGADMSPSPLKVKGQPTPARHKCFELAEDQLKVKNTELVFKWEFPSGRERLCVATRKANDRVRLAALVVVCHYCPFCGETLDEEKGT
jgi:hypothetical protein